MKTSRGHGLSWALAASLAIAAGGLGARTAAADPPPLRLSFLKFTVSDLPAMQGFYEKAFGFHQQKRLDNPGSTEVILSSADGIDLALVYYKDGRKVALGTANGPIGFYLKDVDGTYKDAMAAGATSHSGPVTAGNARVALVMDPEGHEIELLHLN